MLKKIFLVKESSNMALLFGILAIITGLFLPILFGWIGFAIPTVLGVLAIVFAILKNKKLAEDGQQDAEGKPAVFRKQNTFAVFSFPQRMGGKKYT